MSDGIIVGLICCGMGILMLVIGGILLKFHKKKRQRCSETVIGTIVKAVAQEGRSMTGSSGHTVDYNYGIYEYQFNGETYYASSTVSTTGNPPYGKQRVLFINPNEPTDIMEKRFITILPMVVCFGIGVFMCLLGIILGVRA